MLAQVFIAHSAQDAVWVQRLTTMLTPLGRLGLSCWDEAKILPGQHRQEQIAVALSAARVVVMLVSPDFLAFNSVFEQQMSAILATPIQEQRLKVLWVAVRPSLWQQSVLASYQPASDPDKPLAGLSDSEADAALVKICRHIQAAVGIPFATPGSLDYLEFPVGEFTLGSKPPQSSATEFRAACASIVTGSGRGTGYLVRPDCLLTCQHVVASEGEKVRVRFSFGEFDARVGAVDEHSDCAVLHLAQPIVEIAPLSLAVESAQQGSAWACYGFPAATMQSGFLLEGYVQDASGEDLQHRPALVLYSRNITAGAELQGFSGSPVVASGRVIGQLCQVVPDDNSGAQFGVVYACPARVLARLLPSASGSVRRLKPMPPPPKSAYDPAWYLDRSDEEARARRAWETPGAPVVLQAPELFGKTWFLMRMLAEMRERGRTVYINLKTLGAETLATFSTFLRELARLILECCALPAAFLDQAWGRSNNPEANLNWLLSTQVLPSPGASPWLVLALDGADALADKPYFNRFLTLLRGMAEQAALAPWGALRLILTISSTMALRGQDIHRSPLENVAQIIPLADFAPSQVAQMATWYGYRDSGIKQLMDFTGGHPYLIHLALHEAQHRKQPLVDILGPKSRVFDPYLQVCRKRLQQQPELYHALRAVVTDERAAVIEEHATRLIDAGFLIDEYDDRDNRVLRLRYLIYRRLA